MKYQQDVLSFPYIKTFKLQSSRSNKYAIKQVLCYSY